jgi:chemotaxis signal transduction protein
MPFQEKTLGELLKQAGKLSEQQVQMVLGEQKITREPFGKIVIRLGFVREVDILEVLKGMLTLTFSCNQEFFGIETYRIKEVMNYVPIEYKPSLLSPFVGEIALRGEPIPVISLRTILDLSPHSDFNMTWFILFPFQDQLFAVWVDKVIDVQKFQTTEIEPVPPFLFGKRSDLYYCIAKSKNIFYSIINPDKLLPIQISNPLYGV